MMDMGTLAYHPTWHPAEPGFDDGGPDDPEGVEWECECGSATFRLMVSGEVYCTACKAPQALQVEEERQE